MEVMAPEALSDARAAIAGDAEATDAQWPVSHPDSIRQTAFRRNRWLRSSDFALSSELLLTEQPHTRTDPDGQHKPKVQRLCR